MASNNRPFLCDIICVMYNGYHDIGSGGVGSFHSPATSGDTIASRYLISTKRVLQLNSRAVRSRGGAGFNPDARDHKRYEF